MSAFTNGHALLIGVGADLPETAYDVDGLASILKDEARCAYPAEQVHPLCGKQADRPGILAALKALAAECTPQSTVMVFFSGHGARLSHPAIGRRYYLQPYAYDAADMPGTAISGEEFAASLAAIECSKLLLLLDCCHAGGVGMDSLEGEAPKAKSGEMVVEKAPLPEDVRALLGEGSGRAMIASSRADEKSFGGKPYSAFTLALIEAFCGTGASQEDGFVRVSDLAQYTGAKVPLRTNQRQHPILDYQQADNFRVAYYAGGELKPKGLPFDADQAEIEPEPGQWRGWSLRTGDIHAQDGSTVEVAGGDITHISTQGGPYIGSFKGNFVGGNETITQSYQNRSVKVNAPVSGSTIITGDHNVVGTPVDLDGFLEKLADLQAQLQRSNLPAEDREGLEGDLEDVAQQAAAPQPDSGRIRRRLARVLEALKGSALVLAAAPELVDSARQLLEWARGLFG